VKTSTLPFSIGTRFDRKECTGYLKSTIRTAKKGLRAAEEYTDELSHAIKKGPLKAMGIGCAVAFGIGGLAGWLATRR
jgi:hypothetical protein